jgi:hypothetical protein
MCEEKGKKGHENIQNTATVIVTDCRIDLWNTIGKEFTATIFLWLLNKDQW